MLQSYSASFPLIRQIIKQGVEEGLFKTASPDDAAELYIQLSSMYKNSLNGLMIEKTDNSDVMEIAARKLILFQQVVETALGMDRGKLEFKI